MLRYSNTCVGYGVIRLLCTSSRIYASHYDVLGITPKATQTDIKSAYYKLSKVYHPDKSSNEESAKKFRAITEAYEVLGNVKLKKMYDKGLLVGHENTSRMEYKPEAEPIDPTLRFYKSHEFRHVTPTMDGKTPVYNFDAWSKQHYGDLFQRAQYEKELLRKKRQKQNDAKISDRQEGIIYILFAIASLVMLLILHGTADYDNDMTNVRKSAKETPNQNNE